MNIHQEKPEGVENKSVVKGGVQDPSAQHVIKSVGGWGLNRPFNLVTRAMDRIVGKSDVITQPAIDPSGATMHALTWQGVHTIGYTQCPKPAIAHPADILLKITSTSICGSDLHCYTGDLGDMAKGQVMGHEFMGVVEDVGRDVKNIRKGMRVVVSACIAEGTCDYCQRQEYSACQLTNDSKLLELMAGHKICGIFGISHIAGAYPGGQAEYVRVPFADVNCLPVPEDMPEDKALFLSDIVPTSFHGAEMAGVKEGDTVGIWGLGPIGLLTARWCQLRGAARVIGIDCVPARLAFAREQLGIEVIDFSRESTLEALQRMAPRGLDAGVECVGFRAAKSMIHKVEKALGLETDAGDVLTEMIMTVRPFGRIGLVGEYVGMVNHFPIGPLMEKSITLRGGPCPMQKYWPVVLPAVQSGELDPTMVVTHRIGLEQAPEAYEQFYKKEDGMIKVFIRP